MRRRVLLALIATAVTLTVAQPAFANHSTDQRNCAAFSTQAEARAYSAQHPGDPDRLDADNDGLPCEELPAGTAAAARTPQAAAAPLPNTGVFTDRQLMAAMAFLCIGAALVICGRFTPRYERGMA